MGRMVTSRTTTNKFLLQSVAHICYIAHMGASDTLYLAIKAGEVVRPGRCEWCEKLCKPHGHHEDQDKALYVVWLCPKCHSARHLMFKALTGEKSIRYWRYLGENEKTFQATR